MEHARTARIFLAMNAVFSLAIAAGLLLAPASAAGLLFAQPAWWQPISLRLLGVGLLLFGMALILLAKHRFLSKAQVMLITTMDIGWVVGSAILLFAAGSLFSSFGQAAVAAVAGLVAIFALGQYAGAQTIVPPLSKASVTAAGDKILARVSRTVKAPEDVVWRVMNDHAGYADVAANLSKVEVVQGDGLGMQRRCYGPKGENWLETCDLFEDGRAYGFRIHTDAPDYPYPISDLHGEWSVSSEESGSSFTIQIEAKPKGSFLTRALFKLAAKQQFKAVLADLADAWAARMEREAKA